LIILGIVVVARKIAPENREKVTQSVIVETNRRWNHRRNEPACIADIVDVESRRAVDFEIVQKANAPERRNYQGCSNEMEWKWNQCGGWRREWETIKK
jgi:uncharacterized protein YcgI (DUF1989 family)